jgi:two-component system alkaline phosphatase synthesis response regulator PhoP
MNKILLVDDEKDIIEFLQYNLKKEGFSVITANDGIEALNLLKENPDLIVLDIMMPAMDGFEVCRRIRQINDFMNTPVIFLTARVGETDEIKGLTLGANDYIHKPVSPGKLVARVKSNLRNIGKYNVDEPGKINIGPLQIDRDKYEITINGVHKIFPRKEFEILFYLAGNPGKVLSRNDILRNVWRNDVFVYGRTVDVHIRKIREKLDLYADILETVKGVGYRIKRVESNP